MMSLMNQGAITHSIVLLTVLGLLALMASAVLAVIASRTGKGITAARVLGVVLMVATLVPLLLGFVGTAYDNHLLAQAMASAPAESQETLHAAGQRIALFPKLVGVCSTMVCMLPASLLCVFIAGRKATPHAGEVGPPPSAD
jgi:hypothetical protein